MKLRTKIKLKYAWRAQLKMFRHPFINFQIGDRNVTIYEFIRYGWQKIDQIVKD